MDKIQHFGFMSSILSTALTPWYTTTDNNELIEFKDANGVLRNVNAVTIWANDSDLYINVNDSGSCLWIAQGKSLSIDFLLMKSIRVMGNAGITLRWAASYY